MQTTICDCRKEGSSWKLPVYLEMIVNYYGIVNCPQLYSKQSVYKITGNLPGGGLAGKRSGPKHKSRGGFFLFICLAF